MPQNEIRLIYQLGKSPGDPPRGSYTSGVGGARGVVQSLNEADMSTGINLSFVAMLHTLPDDKGPIKALADHIGTMRDEWTVEIYEQLGRQFERYMYDGRPPKKSLTESYRVISESMRKVYPDVMNSPIREALTPKVREIFDNIIGKDDTHPALASESAATANSVTDGIAAAGHNRAASGGVGNEYRGNLAVLREVMRHLLLPSVLLQRRFGRPSLLLVGQSRPANRILRLVTSGSCCGGGLFSIRRRSVWRHMETNGRSVCGLRVGLPARRVALGSVTMD